MAYKVFIDTNVFLDAFLERTDNWADAVEVLQLAETDSIKSYTSSRCLINTIYSLKTQQKLTTENIIAVIELTLGYTNLINPSKTSFLQSLRSGFTDLEDAIQHKQQCQKKAWTSLSHPISQILKKRLHNYRLYRQNNL